MNASNIFKGAAIFVAGIAAKAIFDYGYKKYKNHKTKKNEEQPKEESVK